MKTNEVRNSTTWENSHSFSHTTYIRSLTGRKHNILSIYSYEKKTCWFLLPYCLKNDADYKSCDVLVMIWCWCPPFLSFSGWLRFRWLHVRGEEDESASRQTVFPWLTPDVRTHTHTHLLLLLAVTLHMTLGQKQKKKKKTIPWTFGHLEQDMNRWGTGLTLHADWFRHCCQTKPRWLTSSWQDNTVEEETPQDNRGTEGRFEEKHTSSRTLFYLVFTASVDW